MRAVTLTAVFALSLAAGWLACPDLNCVGRGPWVDFAVVALAAWLVCSLCATAIRRRVTRQMPRAPPVMVTPADVSAQQSVAHTKERTPTTGCLLPLPPRPPPCRRVDYALHPFGFDSYRDTVPRGALIMCEPIAPSKSIAWWTTFKTRVIDRYGGPLSFALACEVHPDLVDQQRWDGATNDGPTNGNRLRPVVGKVVDVDHVTRGQFVSCDGRLQPHGYAIRHYRDGTAHEGLWSRGSWLRGYVYRPPTPDRSSEVCLTPWGATGKRDFSVRWHTWDADGRSRRHVRLYGPSFARCAATPRDAWPTLRHRLYYGAWAPTNSCAVCICNFHNNDQYVQAVDGDGAPTILYYYIDSVPRGQMIANCAWTVIAPRSDSGYSGSVFYPSDTTSPQFKMMADYVLSGRSAEAFSPAQQAAFVDAICAAQAT
ncbi:hypothetical protein psal_cds_940 [Pandoravirus salinus]|uniref:DUF5900 domain-containing protein n=1 Tax=Pandoravirus salinus TaxID=1349410 RepID=S4VXJ7_9VIRU|nr:hypothetical protein psal_cds_940 [Pandoravirus salinus]AGO85083.1 hypothetical protein psal_cds_940 [Pandoravirus salinus]